jgi:hypothetical protein
MTREKSKPINAELLALHDQIEENHFELYGLVSDLSEMTCGDIDKTFSRRDRTYAAFCLRETIEYLEAIIDNFKIKNPPVPVREHINSMLKKALGAQQ